MVDLDGKLWMWGRLADASPRRAAALKKSKQVVMPCLRKSEKHPTPVDMDTVRHVAVGSNHVLVSTCR